MSNKTLAAFTVLFLLIATIWVAWQSSSAAATAAVVNVTITASEMKYEPATIRVRLGQTVNLTFRNASTLMVHELRLKPFVETKAGTGLENTQTFVASAAGTYKFTCNIPGHEAMTGEFIVE